MAYQVDKFDGTFLVSVSDGTIDTTTDLRLVGKNYAGYGELQNENFVHLLENFANTTAPPKAIAGQIWYDSSVKKLKFFDGVKFKVTTGAEPAATSPTSSSIGEFWWNTATKQLYCWSGTDWELVGPEASPELGQTSVVPDVVKDDKEFPLTHSIIKFFVAGKVVAVLSKDEFNLSTENLITGFSVIKQGYTLVNTDVNGVSPADSLNENAFIHWGTASNALTLGTDGLSLDAFILKDEPIFTGAQLAHFEQGYTLGGAPNDYYLRVLPSGSDIVFEQIRGFDSTITMRMKVSTSDERDVAVFTKTGVEPGITDTYDLGTASRRWKTLYAQAVECDIISGNIAGDTVGDHYGNVYHWNYTTLTSDGTIIINAETKQIGYDGAALRGNLIGNVQGNLTGTASNADRLINLNPTVSVPTITDKRSVAIRSEEGYLYATKFIGPSQSTDKVKIDDGATDVAWNAADETTWYRSARTTKTAYTIAARDSAGDISANLFKGTATAARFADLAEKYLTDKEYEVGTVVAIGGPAEVTESLAGDRPIGVISENPAFMMNSELVGGQYIALKGRVPVKVVGPVMRGQRLVASAVPGYACASFGGSTDVFAIAMETSSDSGQKVIEAVVL